MTDKLLDLFLKTPIAKSIAIGLIERGLLALCMAIGTWLAIDTPDYAEATKKFVAEASPYIVAGVFAAIAVKRITNSQVKLEVARVSDAELPRPLLDAKVASMSKDERKDVVATLWNPPADDDTDL